MCRIPSTWDVSLYGKWSFHHFVHLSFFSQQIKKFEGNDENDENDENDKNIASITFGTLWKMDFG